MYRAAARVLMSPIASVIHTVRRNLKLKLILFVVGILGLTAGIAPWISIQAQRRQLLTGSGEHVRSLQRILQAVIEASMLAKDQGEVQHVLETFGSRKGLKAVRIFGTDGVIHFSSQPAERGSRLSPEELERLRKAGNPMAVTREGDGKIHRMVWPLFNRPACFSCHGAKSKVLGILEIDLSLGRVARKIAWLRKWALNVTLVTLGVVVIGLWLALTLLIDHPLQRLVDTILKVETGDLSVRAPVHSPDELGELSGHFNRMVTELEGAHQELEQYHREQMARADRLATVGQMAAAIAHEIRNPLTGISGALSVLGRDCSPEDPRRDILRQTRQLIDRLNKTVEDILDYSRPSLPQAQVTDVDAIVDRGIALVEGEAKRAGIRVVKDLPVAADAGQAALYVRVDPHQIQQVLMNLMLNAIQATSAGGEVRIRTRPEGNHGGDARVCLTIQDTGKGMTAEDVSKVFDPFYSTKAHGTGLGLSIARQIVEQHEGTIRVESEPGVGTAVTLELPAHEPIEPGSVTA